MTTDLRKLYVAVLTKKKPPPVDESVWLADSKIAFLYAKYIRKSRLSEEQEKCFYSDMRSSYHYLVFLQEINQVSEHLHNMMLMSNLVELSVDEKKWVNEYFQSK